jgi:cytoskeletal protein RodZ
MKVKRTLMTLGIGLLAAVTGYSQTPNPGQSNSPAPSSNSAQNPDSNQQTPNSEQNSNPEQKSPQAANAPASDMTFEGRLLKIDTAAKTISVAGLSGKEGAISDMSFKYDESTVVVGGDRTAQGLDGKTGSLLKVTYQPDHEINKASRIEISDKP